MFGSRHKTIQMFDLNFDSKSTNVHISKFNSEVNRSASRPKYQDMNVLNMFSTKSVHGIKTECPPRGEEHKSKT